jgi:hypothetical protein
MILNVDGETNAIVGGTKAWVEEIDFWLDPKTNQMNPRKWKMWAIVEGKGRFEADVTAYGRVLYVDETGGYALTH